MTPPGLIEHWASAEDLVEPCSHCRHRQRSVVGGGRRRAVRPSSAATCEREVIGGPGYRPTR